MSLGQEDAYILKNFINIKSSLIVFNIYFVGGIFKLV